MSKKSIHKTAIILSAVDRMSTVVNRAFGKAEQRLTNFQKRADKVAKSSAAIGRTAGTIGTVVAAPLVLAARSAMAFEESMADVSKVLNLQQGSRELNLMGAESQKLAVHLGKAPKDAAAMIAALAQGGTAKKELFTIGKFTGEMSVAFDIMGSRAGDAFTKTKNAMGGTTRETMAVMNAINHLSDNTAAKAGQILDFMASGGAGVARALKLSGQESASLGAFFISMGKSGSEAATIIERMSKGLQKNSKVGKLFRAEGGGMQGLLKVMEIGNKLSGTDRFNFFKEFGQYGQDIALAASNMDNLRKTTGMVGDASKFANSVGAEFANRSNTRAFEMKRVQAQLETLAIKIGGALLPVVSELATALTPVLNSFADWIGKNPKLTSQIVKGLAAFAAMNFAVSGIAFVVSGAASTLSFFSKGLVLVTTGLGYVTTAVSWLGAVIVANPIGAAIAAVAIAALLIYKYWEPIKGFFSRSWDGITARFQRVVSFVKSFVPNFFAAGKNIISAIGNGMLSVATAPVRVMQKMVGKMRRLLPFSPAKDGPFKDLHKIRIVETIADAIKPNAAIQAMKRTVTAIGQVDITGGSLQPSLAGGGGGGVNINFNPTINLVGGGEGGNINEQIITGLRSFSGELLDMINQEQQLKNSRKF